MIDARAAACRRACARRSKLAPLKGRPWSRCRAPSPTSRRSLGPSSTSSSKERELFMQSSRRTSAVAFFACEACRAAFPMDVPTHWTMAHVLAFHFGAIPAPISHGAPPCALLLFKSGVGSFECVLRCLPSSWPSFSPCEPSFRPVCGRSKELVSWSICTVNNFSTHTHKLAHKPRSSTRTLRGTSARLRDGDAGRDIVGHHGSLRDAGEQPVRGRLHIVTSLTSSHHTHL